MRAVKRRDTSPEIMVRRFLHRLGYRFRLQDKNLPGTPMLFFQSSRWRFFVHGCFWHRHINCKKASIPASNSAYWKKKFEDNIDRDKNVICNLKSIGWQVVIIWECETTNCDDLGKILLNRLSKSSN
jgi:DNA mismatch endonuclease (patch repair protein)